MSDLGATEWTTSTPRSSSVTFVSLLDLLVTHLIKGQEMNSTVAASTRWSPFTAAQWQELEHQELIFKYLTAGVPVPPELIIPIRRSFEALPTGRYFHRPPLGYCSFNGKKPDLEPGRCRRTDGKKWRCSKRAYGDSKYCERHMHRGRSRSRNTVESRTTFHTQSTSPASNLLVPAGNGDNGSSSQLHNMHRGPFDNRSSSEISAMSRGLMPLQVSSLPTTKAVDPPTLQASYAQAQDLGQVTVCSLPRQQQQQQRLFFGSDHFSPSEPAKHVEHQTLRPFFDEWPKTRDSWSGLHGEGSNRSSFSTTQLSISTPLATSPGFSTATSRSTKEG